MKKSILFSAFLLLCVNVICAQSIKYPEEVRSLFKSADSTVTPAIFSKPVIGIPQGSGAYEMFSSVLKNGGVPVVIPTGTDDFNVYRDLASSLDGFSFTDEFAEAPSPLLLKAVAEQNLPYLGSCSLMRDINRSVLHSPDSLGDMAALVKKASTFKRAKQLMDRIMTLDTHGDLACRYRDRDKASLGARKGNQISIARMYEGHLSARYVVDYLGQGPIDKNGLDSAVVRAFNILSQIEADVEKYSDYCGIARNPDDAYRLKMEGKKAIFLSLENGYGLGTDLGNIEKLAKRGVTYITLSHSGDNQICHTCSRAKDPMAGLTDFGKKVVKEMNRLGIIIDLSHPSEGTFWEVIKLSKAPVVFTHSGSKAIHMNDRSVTDEQLKALARNGGVIQIFLCRGFMGGKHIGLNDFIQHLEHCIEVAGIDHVGVGVDLDGGAGGWNYYSDSDAINLTVALLERGYSEADIRKIWGENFFRVMKEVQALRQTSR